jgi:hypothetical protein
MLMEQLRTLSFGEVWDPPCMSKSERFHRTSGPSKDTSGKVGKLLRASRHSRPVLCLDGYFSSRIVHSRTF